jgi:hypothetical protein
MLAMILIVSMAALARAGVQLVSLWRQLPHDNRDFGLV